MELRFTQHTSTCKLSSDEEEHSLPLKGRWDNKHCSTSQQVQCQFSFFLRFGSISLLGLHIFRTNGTKAWPDKQRPRPKLSNTLPSSTGTGRLDHRMGWTCSLTVNIPLIEADISSQSKNLKRQRITIQFHNKEGLYHQ